MEGEARQRDDKDSLRKGGDEQIGDGGQQECHLGSLEVGEKTESTLSQNQPDLYPLLCKHLTHVIPDQETLLCTP